MNPRSKNVCSDSDLSGRFFGNDTHLRWPAGGPGLGGIS